MTLDHLIICHMTYTLTLNRLALWEIFYNFLGFRFTLFEGDGRFNTYSMTIYCNKTCFINPFPDINMPLIQCDTIYSLIYYIQVNIKHLCTNKQNENKRRDITSCKKRNCSGPTLSPFPKTFLIVF